MLNLFQQQFANRYAVSALLVFGMDRTKARQQKRQAAFVALRARFKTNVEFSDALGEGFSPSYVSQLLNGIRGIGDDVATKIEERLGLRPNHLDREGDPIGLTDDERTLLAGFALLDEDTQRDWLDAAQRRIDAAARKAKSAA